MATWIYIAAGVQLVLGLLELFRWPSTTKLLLGISDRTFNDQSRPLGQNFAAYNILVAAGLVATLSIDPAGAAKQVQLWLLCSIVVAAVIGGITTKWFLALLQGAVPAVAIFFLMTAGGP
ncbi:MAG: DUF1304 family protein [Pseudomonadota bacterium]